jgi:hypothetical protein
VAAGKTCIVRTERGATLYLGVPSATLKFDLPAPFAEVPLDVASTPDHSLAGRRSTLGVDAERSPPLPDLLASVPVRGPPNTHASA